MMKFIFLIVLALVAFSDPVSGETTAYYAIQVESYKDLQKAAKKTKERRGGRVPIPMEILLTEK